MPRKTPSPQTEIDFDKAARDYCKRLPMEHFMEAVVQATQRKIFVVAGDLVHFHCPDVQFFSELLIQWLIKNQRKPGQVVPDNMVVVWHEPIKAKTSYSIPKQPVGPFWVLEYVTRESARKDYEVSFEKYEKELKVPYYLIFYLDIDDLSLFRHNGRKYVSVKPNQHGRYPIPELEMEVGMLDGWARFWFRGELLPLPAELQQELDKARKERDEARKDRDEARDSLQKVNENLQKEVEARQALEQELERLRAEMKKNGKPKKP